VVESLLDAGADIRYVVVFVFVRYYIALCQIESFFLLLFILSFSWIGCVSYTTEADMLCITEQKEAVLC
jgi:hypothetical protein